MSRQFTGTFKSIEFMKITSRRVDEVNFFVPENSFRDECKPLTANYASPADTVIYVSVTATDSSYPQTIGSARKPDHPPCTDERSIILSYRWWFGNGYQRRSNPYKNGKVMNLLHDSRILIVEDDSLLSEDIKAELLAKGAEILGPTGSLQDAQQLLAAEPVDFVVVGVNLGGAMSCPLIDILRDERVPLLLISVYDQAALPEPYRTLPFLAKPMPRGLLIDAIEASMNDAIAPSSQR